MPPTSHSAPSSTAGNPAGNPLTPPTSLSLTTDAFDGLLIEGRLDEASRAFAHLVNRKNGVKLGHQFATMLQASDTIQRHEDIARHDRHIQELQVEVTKLIQRHWDLEDINAQQAQEINTLKQTTADQAKAIDTLSKNVVGLQKAVDLLLAKKP